MNWDTYTKRRDAYRKDTEGLTFLGKPLESCNGGSWGGGSNVYAAKITKDFSVQFGYCFPDSDEGETQATWNGFVFWNGRELLQVHGSSTIRKAIDWLEILFQTLQMAMLEV